MELLGRYSNHDTILPKLQHLLEVKPYRSPQRARKAKPKQRQTRLTAGRVDDLVQRYLAGADLNELADAFHVHRRTVAAQLKRRGVAQRKHGLSSEQVDRAVGLYAQGLSLARIADQLGVYPQSIRYQLLRTGVRLRDAHGRER